VSADAWPAKAIAAVVKALRMPPLGDDTDTAADILAALAGRGFDVGARWTSCDTCRAIIRRGCDACGLKAKEDAL
jgi:ADP-ribosylglycohydrolase